MATKGQILRPLAERFWEKVEVGAPDECWRWTGWMRANGRYGAVWVDGRHRPAPQVAWELKNGVPFPSGMMACHTCDHTWCVNPSHVWPGTMSDNIKDAVAKGRHDSTGNGYKTHCKRGHAFTPENTEIRPSTGHRTCKQCRKMHNDKLYRSTTV